MKNIAIILFSFSLLFLSCEKEKFVPRIIPNSGNQNASGIYITSGMQANATYGRNSEVDISFDLNNTNASSFSGSLYIYLSKDSSYSSNDIAVSSKSVDVYGNSAQKYIDTYTIPTNVSDGKYYFVAVLTSYQSAVIIASKSVAANISGTASVPRSINLKSTTFDRTSYPSGSAIEINYTLENTTKNSVYVTMSVYFSTDSIFSTNDITLSRTSYSSSSFTVQDKSDYLSEFNTTIPEDLQTGKYYIITSVSYSENYNTKSFYNFKEVSVTSAPPSVIISTGSLNSTTYIAGQALSGSVTIQKKSSSSSYYNNNIYVYFVTDTTASTANNYNYDSKSISLSNGVNNVSLSDLNVSSSLTIGTQYYVKVEVIYNSKTYRKIIGSFTVTPLIVSITGLSIANTNINSNGSISFTTSFNNPSSYSVYKGIVYYLSSDDTYSSDDFKIGEYSSQYISSNTYNETNTIANISNLSIINAGSYYLIARLNYGTSETPSYYEYTSNSILTVVNKGTVIFSRNVSTSVNRYIYVNNIYEGYINSFYSNNTNNCSEYIHNSSAAYVKLNKAPGTYTYSITDSSTPGAGNVISSGSFTVTTNSCEIINITL